MSEHLGKIFFFLGLGMAVMGTAIWSIGKLGVFLGKIPGDFHFKTESFLLSFPFISCLILSVVLTLLLNLFFLLFGRR